ncbi:glucosidase II beta subunit-like-domain-containing protein [Fomitopsis betulina]|nr:glucosidase II beta subunit-like-domain-containing protein [Fomitopsis betulina]
MLWLLLALPIPALAGIEKTSGVPPSLLSRYRSPGSDTASWSCLDGTKFIPWSAVNDDYCDCLDGSDEPGTGACPTGAFYCHNEGHIGSLIPSTRVRDGLCEPECCDGSDERPGVCPNVCKEVGETYRKQQDAERKLRRTGSKIRSLYLAHAQKEKKRLEDKIAAADAEIKVREKEVARLKDIADTAESLSETAMQHKKESPLYQSLIEHSLALKSLQREHQKHLEREKALGDILDALRLGYNPNYQDMAVLEAVRGWEALAGLPHINDVRKEEGSTETESAVAQEEETNEEGEWSAGRLDKELDSLLKTDYETLLIQHDKHIGAPGGGSLLFNLASYIPDAYLPRYLALRDTLVSWLEIFGIAKGIDSDGSSDDSAARKAYQDAESTLNSVRKDLDKAQNELERLFDPEWFGPEGEWKKLEGTCLAKDTGEYTYEVCLFGEAKQKPNKGGSFQSLGKFTHWNNAPGVELGSPEYYTKQYYERGAKCWNGPMRSVTVITTCGTENALLSVSEPEKCEYQITMTSPAVCLPLKDNEAQRDEL